MLETMSDQIKKQLFPDELFDELNEFLNSLNNRSRQTEIVLSEIDHASQIANTSQEIIVIKDQSSSLTPLLSRKLKINGKDQTPKKNKEKSALEKPTSMLNIKFPVQQVDSILLNKFNSARQASDIDRQDIIDLIRIITNEMKSYNW
jgi:hypothetical protein